MSEACLAAVAAVWLLWLCCLPAEHREEHTKVSGGCSKTANSSRRSVKCLRSESVLLPCVLSAVAVVRVRVRAWGAYSMGVFTPGIA